MGFFFTLGARSTVVLVCAAGSALRKVIFLLLCLTGLAVVPSISAEPARGAPPGESAPRASVIFAEAEISSAPRRVQALVINTAGQPFLLPAVFAETEVSSLLGFAAYVPPRAGTPAIFTFVAVDAAGEPAATPASRASPANVFPADDLPAVSMRKHESDARAVTAAAVTAAKLQGEHRDARLREEAELRLREAERLRKQVAAAWTENASSDLDAVVMQLQPALRDTAKRTSTAVRRESRRKKELALTRQAELVLAQEAATVDLASLAREALELRKRRRELESQLRLETGDLSDDF